MTCRRTGCLMAILLAGTSAADGGDPALPPGQDRGGSQVMVVVSSGIDYADPKIEPRLARDGEGELIGWDFVDGDNRPYAKGPADRAEALALEVMPGARIIPVRASADDPATFAGALLFASATPARSLILAIAPAGTKGWQELERTARERDELHVGLLACALADGTRVPEGFAALANVRIIPCP